MAAQPDTVTDDAAFQVLVDTDASSDDAVSRGSLPLALLSLGLLVTVLALQFGIFFVFLPIIPLGLGGGTALRRWIRRAWPRALRIYGGSLRLVTLGPFGPFRRALLPIRGGVRVSLVMDGMAGHHALRIESGGEELWILLTGVAHGLDVLHRLPPFFEEAGVPATFDQDSEASAWN